jgi:hypothetical protein
VAGRFFEAGASDSQGLSSVDSDVSAAIFDDDGFVGVVFFDCATKCLDDEAYSRASFD